MSKSSKEKVIGMLKDMKVIEGIERATSVAIKFFGDVPEETKKGAGKKIIEDVIADEENEELRDAFFEYAFDIALDSIVDSLELKADEKVVPDTTEKLAAILTLIEKL